MTEDEQYPLENALRRKRWDDAMDLLEAGGADVLGFEFESPLAWSVIHGHMPSFEALLEADADVNQANKHGWRPLHRAAFVTNRVAFARRLIELGAELDARTKNNFPTALHKAATEGDEKLVCLLLEAGASTTQPCPTNMSLEEAAAKRKRGNIVKLLRAHTQST